MVVFLLETTNILLHITTCNGSFQIILEPLDQMSILTPLAPFYDELFLEFHMKMQKKKKMKPLLQLFWQFECKLDDI